MDDSLRGELRILRYIRRKNTVSDSQNDLQGRAKYRTIMPERAQVKAGLRAADRAADVFMRRQFVKDMEKP